MQVRLEMNLAVGRKCRSSVQGLADVGLRGLWVEDIGRLEGWESFVLPLSEPVLLWGSAKHSAWSSQQKALQ